MPIDELCHDLGWPCAREPREVFTLGFTTDSTRLARGAAVVAVTPASAVERAGLRVGDVLTGRVSYWNGDPTREALVQVRRGADTLDVTFLPAARPSIPQVDPIRAVGPIDALFGR